MALVKRFVPPMPNGSQLAVAETATNYAAAFGVTSVQDVSADDNTEIYRELLRQGKLKTRIYDCSSLSDWQKPAKAGLKKADGDLMIRRGCLKGTAEDGTDATAARLYQEIAAADRAGLQVTVHAVGARANEQILSVFERVRRENGARDRRFRVEHAHAFRPQDLRRFADSGIIASVQPYLFSDREGRSLTPLRDLTAGNAALAFGSDSSIIPVNPLSGIAAAVNTNDPKQKITVEEAVRFYTLGSAYAEFQETEKGTIALGKLADFVILSDDIFSIKPNEISKTRVLTTIVDGRVVFEAK
jgi:predicted amidohydrolase YtcJ